MKKRFWTGLLTALLLCAGLLCAAGTGAAETIDLPDGVKIPSKAECEAFDGWDKVRVDDYASVYYMYPRGNLPYKATVQFVGTQVPGFGLELNITGTEMDPRADRDSKTVYNAIQIYYTEEHTSPLNIWVTTIYDKVSSLFDNVYFSLYYDGAGQTITSGIAQLGINGEFLRLNYWYGWDITEEAKTMLNADGLMDQRLAWLNSYKPKPLTLRKVPRLSFYDLMVKPKDLNLPADLQEIGSQAFTGVSAEKAVVPPTVQTIADDAFDEGIVLVLPDSRLEEWAKEKHPNYSIGQ